MNRNELLKNFAIGFIPIFIFIAADELFGTEIGLAVAVASGVVYLGYYYWRYRRLEKMILFDTGLIVLMGGISIALHDDIFFKLKPALIELILVVLVGIHAFSSRPILLTMSKRYLGDTPIPPQQVQLMRQLSRLLFVVFLIHTLLIVYSAYFWSKAVWAFISGGLFYILFGLIALGQWIYLKYFRKPQLSVKEEQAGEWFDLLDEKGKIVGRAPRSAVHGNPQLLHATVHLHVFNRSGQLYLQKRSPTKDLYPGLWDTAVGGHVHSGESVEKALQREAAEELGISLTRVRPLFRYIMRNDFESEMVHAFAQDNDGPFHLNPEEIETGRFWSGFEIRRMIGKGLFTPNFEQEFKLLEKQKLI